MRWGFFTLSYCIYFCLSFSVSLLSLLSILFLGGTGRRMGMIYFLGFLASRTFDKLPLLTSGPLFKNYHLSHWPFFSKDCSLGFCLLQLGLHLFDIHSIASVHCTKELLEFLETSFSNAQCSVLLYIFSYMTRVLTEHEASKTFSLETIASFQIYHCNSTYDRVPK